MLDLLLIIGLVISISVFIFKDPYIAFAGISMVMIANLALFSPLYQSKFKTKSPTLSFFLFLIAYYPVSKNTSDSFRIFNISIAALLETYFVIMLIGWLFNFSIPQTKQLRSKEALISALDGLTKTLYRIIVGLLFIKWTRFIPISSERIEIMFALFAGLGILFALYLDLVADKSVLLRLGDTSLGSLSHTINTAIFQLLILGFLFGIRRIQMLFWKYYILSVLIVSIVGLYSKFQAYSMFHPRIRRILGISTDQLDFVAKLDPQGLKELATERGFQLPEGSLENMGIHGEALVVPLGKKISDQALTISLANPSNMAIIPSVSINQIVNKVLSQTNSTMEKLPRPSPQTIEILTESFPQIKEGLSQIATTLDQYKQKLIERLSRTPFIEIQELDGFSRVKIPGIIDVVETPKGEIVKTFGLKIAQTGTRSIIDGWLRIVEMDDWEYVNVLGIIRVLEHKTLNYQEVRIPGFRFREGVPPKPFEELEQKILEKISVFWSNAFIQLIPEFQPKMLILVDGEVKALPVSSEDPAFLPSDPFKAFDNLLVAETEQLSRSVLESENMKSEHSSSEEIRGKIIKPDYEVLDDD